VWGEHKDGSLIFIASVENHRVIFEIFDLSVGKVIEYRDAMSETDFKRKFSWSSPDKLKAGPWEWHNRTPFPWDKIIAAGFPSGTRLASAQDVLDHADNIRQSRARLLDNNGDNRSAAQQVADDLQVQGTELLADEIDSLVRRYVRRPMRRFASELTDMISRRFGGGKDGDNRPGA
jgi:hypothetical protein